MPMKPREVRAELVLRGLTLAGIARSLNVSRAHVWQVVAGRRRSPRVEDAVAEAIESTAEEVFGPIPNGAAA